MFEYFNPDNWKDDNENTSTLLDRLNLNVPKETTLTSVLVEKKKEKQKAASGNAASGSAASGGAASGNVFLEDRFKERALFEKKFMYPLSSCNYKEFTKYHEVVIVMFHQYLDAQTREAIRMYNLASTQTVRPNHKYAYVDCRTENDLCKEQMVTQFPMFKLYKYGKFSGSIRDSTDLTVEKIKGLVEDVKFDPMDLMYPQRKAIVKPEYKKKDAPKPRK